MLPNAALMQLLLVLLLLRVQLVFGCAPPLASFCAAGRVMLCPFAHSSHQFIGKPLSNNSKVLFLWHWFESQHNEGVWGDAFAWVACVGLHPPPLPRALARVL